MKRSTFHQGRLNFISRGATLIHSEENSDASEIRILFLRVQDLRNPLEFQKLLTSGVSSLPVRLTGYQHIHGN